MNVKIYVDDLFFYSFIYDYIIIETCLFLVKSRTKRLTKFIIAGINAALYCIYFIEIKNTMPDRYLPDFIYGILSCMLTAILFAGRKSRLAIKHFIILFAVTVFYGGLFSYLFMNTYIGYFWAKLQTGGNIIFEIFFIILIIYLSFKLIRGLIGTILRAVREENDICIVEIKLNNQKIVMRALLDTGNKLVEPASQKPVSIVEADILKPFLNMKLQKVYCIPFISVGSNMSSLYGIEVDELKIITERGKKIENNVIIGIYKGSLSAGNEYSMILNSQYVLNFREEKE